MLNSQGRTFNTISPQGLNHDLPPMRLWQKAKRLGIWNPGDIDFSQDKVESRHIAFAVYFLSRLIAEYGDRAWNALEERMNELLPLAIETNNEMYEVFGEDNPFQLGPEEFNNYAISQFTKRMDRLARARGQSMEEVVRLANTLDEATA